MVSWSWSVYPEFVKDDHKSFTGGMHMRGELSELYVYQDWRFFFRKCTGSGRDSKNVFEAEKKLP